METRNIAAGVAVAPQVGPADVASLKAAGFASVICNRPDGEGADQPPFAAVEAEARRHGMMARYLPVEPGKVTAQDGVAFAALMQELPGPLVAYCRTGTRAEALWQLARQAGEQP